MRAAERYDRLQRYAHRRDRNGLKNGAIGHVGLEVLRELLRLVDYRTGRLDPAIATLATRIGRSIAATAAALKRLKDHGFLTWLRRYEPTGGEGLRGPQVRQISNAYALLLPATAQLEPEAPLPEDDAHRREMAATDHETMIASLPLQARMEATTDDPELATLLASLGRKLGVA